MSNEDALRGWPTLPPQNQPEGSRSLTSKSWSPDTNAAMLGKRSNWKEQILSGENPFTPHVMPLKFIGRQAILRDILDSLQPGSASLVGETKTGKSSLLLYLQDHLKNLRSPDGRYIPIYLSMDTQRSQATFCKSVLERLLPEIPSVACDKRTLRTLENSLKADKPITMENIEKVLEWAGQSRLRVVLLLDEFKAQLERPDQFDNPFRSLLRSWYTQSKIRLVMATRQPLHEIEGLQGYSVNSVLQYQLGLFTQDEAEALIRQPHDRTFNNDELQLALRVGCKHPLRLQSAGWRLYTWKTQPLGPIYHHDGTLRNNAFDLLKEWVDSESRLTLPKPPETFEAVTTIEPVDVPSEQKPPGILKRLWKTLDKPIKGFYRASKRLGKAIEDLKSLSYVAFLIFAFMILMLYAFGFLTPEQIPEPVCQAIAQLPEMISNLISCQAGAS